MKFLLVIIAASAWFAMSPARQLAAVGEIREWLADTNANPIGAVTYTNAAGQAYLVASYSASHITNFPSIADAARLEADYGAELVATDDPAGELGKRGLKQ